MMKFSNFGWYILLAFFLFLITSTAFAQYRCDWNVVSGGGEYLTTTDFRATASAIQTAIGFSQSVGFQIFSGFFTFDTVYVGIQKPEKQLASQKLITNLYPNKPNPFSSNTTIRYSLGSEDLVGLKIYDITGREVTTLVSGKQKPGIYALNWNGKDAQNAKLAYGIYFLKFKTSSYTATQKLLWLE